MDDLETHDLLLEPWHESRRESFAFLAADPRVTRHIGDGAVWSRARADQVFAQQLDHWRRHGSGWRTAIMKESGAWLGFIGLNHVGPDATEIDDRDEVEIGWWLHPSVWGRGLATQGAFAIRDEAFRRIGLDRVIGRYQPANVASGRIMQRLGMEHERDAVDKYGNVVRIYGLGRARWLELVNDP